MPSFYLKHSVTWYVLAKTSYCEEGLITTHTPKLTTTSQAHTDKALRGRAHKHAAISKAFHVVC